MHLETDQTRKTPKNNIEKPNKCPNVTVTWVKVSYQFKYA